MEIKKNEVCAQLYLSRVAVVYYINISQRIFYKGRPLGSKNTITVSEVSTPI